MVGRDFGPFHIERLIAVGGMAEVYLARTLGVGGLEKRLALKVIRPHFAEDDHFIHMLVEEAKIAVQLNHANIAQVYDLGCIDGTYYLTMEFIDGPDLFRVLKRASQMRLDLPIELCGYIAAQLTSGLDFAHRRTDVRGQPLGLVHRDVSPQNVLISQAGEVKLVDFGIAKAALRAGQTRAGVIKGKYYYMSPEQAWGDPVDHRSDIFSTGVLLYEMLAGGMLYPEEEIDRLIGLVRRADIEPVRRRRPDCPLELERIVMKALAKERDERYPSGRYFEIALVRFLASFAPEFGPGRLAQQIRQLGFDDTVSETTSDKDAIETRLTKADLGSILAHSVIANREGEQERTVNAVPYDSAEPQQVRGRSEPTHPLGRDARESLDITPDRTAVSSPPAFSSATATSRSDSRVVAGELVPSAGEDADDLARVFGTPAPPPAPTPDPVSDSQEVTTLLPEGKRNRQRVRSPILVVPEPVLQPRQRRASVPGFAALPRDLRIDADLAIAQRRHAKVIVFSVLLSLAAVAVFAWVVLGP